MLYCGLVRFASRDQVGGLRIGRDCYQEHSHVFNINLFYAPSAAYDTLNIDFRTGASDFTRVQRDQRQATIRSRGAYSGLINAIITMTLDWR